MAKDQENKDQENKDREKRFAVAANFGLTATRTALQNQARLLRFWADNIERAAHIYDKETEALKSDLEHGSPRQEHAA